MSAVTQQNCTDCWVPQGCVSQCQYRPISVAQLLAGESNRRPVRGPLTWTIRREVQVSWSSTRGGHPAPASMVSLHSSCLTGHVVAFLGLFERLYSIYYIWFVLKTSPIATSHRCGTNENRELQFRNTLNLKNIPMGMLLCNRACRAACCSAKELD